MLEIKIVWIIINTIVAIWFSLTVLMNHIPSIVSRKCGNLVSIIVAFVVNVVLAIAVCLFVSVAIGVIVTSFVAYSWGLISYFLLQRFANVIDRPHMFRSKPMLQPLVTFGCFLSSTQAISFFADWRLAFLPFVLWFLLGYLFAEMAIRHYIRELKRMGKECNRRHAICALNYIQGRHDPMTILKNRYPFP